MEVRKEHTLPSEEDTLSSKLTWVSPPEPPQLHISSTLSQAASAGCPFPGFFRLTRPLSFSKATIMASTAAALTWVLALFSGRSPTLVQYRRLGVGLGMEAGGRDVHPTCPALGKPSVSHPSSSHSASSHPGRERLLGLLQPEQRGQRQGGAEPTAEAGVGAHVSGRGHGVHGKPAGHGIPQAQWATGGMRC